MGLFSDQIKSFVDKVPEVCPQCGTAIEGATLMEAVEAKRLGKEYIVTCPHCKKTWSFV